jgi:hypothetical protein
MRKQVRSIDQLRRVACAPSELLDTAGFAICPRVASGDGRPTSICAD